MAKNDPKMTLGKFASNVTDNFIKGAALGPLGTVISKYGEGLIPKSAEFKIWELALKEISKNASKGELSLDKVSKKLEEPLFSPREMKIYVAMIAKKLGKDILKSH
ncbi:MAG: hypothetical protein GQ535_09025 [Rhodobacteraceae bacterium]|nr:hypothetical protein [Paracoccaceae bacterium]